MRVRNEKGDVVCEWLYRNHEVLSKSSFDEFLRIMHDSFRFMPSAAQAHSSGPPAPGSFA